MHQSTRLKQLQQHAYNIRLRVLEQAALHGQGYIGQGMQSADLFALLYFSELDWNSNNLEDPQRDRFLLSTGHYAISIYATFVVAGLLPPERMQEYGVDGSALTLGAEIGLVPGIEFAGSSLGQGLGTAAGLALGFKMQQCKPRVFNYMSDGETQEGATWEAAMFAGAHKLDNLTNIIDVNRTQADGPLVLEIEPLAEKYRAFGWWVEEVNGNDMAALIQTFARAKATTGKPKAIICHTTIGSGSPTLSSLPKAHFIRIDQEQWREVLEEFKQVSTRISEEEQQ